MVHGCVAVSKSPPLESGLRSGLDPDTRPTVHLKSIIKLFKLNCRCTTENRTKFLLHFTILITFKSGL